MPSLCPGLHIQHSLLDGFLKLPTSLWIWSHIHISSHTLWLPRTPLLFSKIFIWLHSVLVMVLRIFMPECGCVPVRGIFHCGAQASLAVAHGLCCPTACGILVPWPGIKPVSMSRVLEGRFLTTGPPGKSQPPYFPAHPRPPDYHLLPSLFILTVGCLRSQAASNLSFFKDASFFWLDFLNISFWGPVLGLH